MKETGICEVCGARFGFIYWKRFCAKCKRTCCKDCLNSVVKGGVLDSPDFDRLKLCSDCIVAESTTQSISIHEDLEMTGQINSSLKLELKQKIMALEKFRNLLLQIASTFGPNSDLLPNSDLYNTNNTLNTIDSPIGSDPHKTSDRPPNSDFNTPLDSINSTDSRPNNFSTNSGRNTTTDSFVSCDRFSNEPSIQNGLDNDYYDIGELVSKCQDEFESMREKIRTMRRRYESSIINEEIMKIEMDRISKELELVSNERDSLRSSVSQLKILTCDMDDLKQQYEDVLNEREMLLARCKKLELLLHSPRPALHNVSRNLQNPNTRREFNRFRFWLSSTYCPRFYSNP
uniref:FYVE-type domain-containing protein n=1 Tax=Theileria annulata TaxID=5874 RepID=A0A3B0MPP2_THEAN